MARLRYVLSHGVKEGRSRVRRRGAGGVADSAAGSGWYPGAEPGGPASEDQEVADAVLPCPAEEARRSRWGASRRAAVRDGLKRRRSSRPAPYRQALLVSGCAPAPSARRALQSESTVAAGFGLLHGLGFAGALAEVGLPTAEIPLALFTFNVGIELGQLAFVGVVP